MRRRTLKKRLKRLMGERKGYVWMRGWHQRIGLEIASTGPTLGGAYIDKVDEALKKKREEM